ncbi:hypothetical protein BX616_001673 [Lobosporangium transversale]|uniref:DUF221-domain-containing protein n=1 Tax=Lobosporangium transversale TaxID=64571 RepID=A0A1Y2H2X9_9FUNG|nr:hypothetical protein BCR41DRAFT_418008 [Lobosporangium transversale]KAF9917193.1 hypothetical protein BX616_001673 [Lobosporangium transversale]ORZ28907.1 hypothetical protein BCR41DRAFT_418008 [Lobosporangium transversale]|eukprot:XP_021886580.1 hypothetical protein BCR41DRAFT_418008 [Lobosporangium transversale]
MTSISQAEKIAAINELQPTALATNLGINVGLSLLTLGAFCWLRPKNGVIYARKYKASPQDKRAPRLEEGWFSWMKPVWSCPDEVLMDKIGLDAVVFIRFLRMCRNVFIVMAIIGCCVLIPINVIITKRVQMDGKEPTDKIGMLTMAGVEEKNWLWAHVAACWFFSLLLYYATFHGYKTFLKFRIHYFQSEAYQEEMASRTLMLAGLPSSLQSDDKLANFMNGMGLPEKAVLALVGRKVDKLPELMDKHKQMVKALEKVVAKYYADPNRLPSKRPTVRAGGLCGSKIDAIDFYSQRIEELTDQIEKTRMQVNTSQPTNYGFVSYETIHAAHRVAKILSDPLELRKRSKMIDPPDVFLSPVPKDIIWFNVSNPKQLRKSRKVIVNTAFVVFSLLFFIPMGLLTTIAKLERIVAIFPDLGEYFKDHKFAASMLQSLLPVLIMDILLHIVRKIIVYLAWFQGSITKSSMDRSTLAKFYLFFTINNLIIFAISGMILGFYSDIKLFLSSFKFSLATWSLIKDFVNRQDNIVQLLSQKVIDTSLFWVNYISLRNFSALLDLSQIVSLILYWAKTTVTPRESKNMNKPDVFDFPLYFSAHMFLLTVALLYSVVAPLILFFTVVYFSLASLTYKYQLMYVFRTKIETGGRLFRVVYNRLLAALILFQIVMIGVLNLKTAHTHSLALIPLPILTILFKLFLSKRYNSKIDYYDYGMARDERHLFKNNKSKGNPLLISFENPALKSKVVAALVPDGAKKILSQKVLNGENKSSSTPKEGKRSASAARVGSHSRTPSQGGKNSSRTQHNNDESYEMSHVSKGSEKYGRVQSPTRQQQRYDYDSTDQHFDDQKESLTRSATHQYGDTYNSSTNNKAVYQPPTPKIHGAQDMTSFVAGRYRADRAADPYSYSTRSNNNGAGSGNGADFMEKAKSYQTDSYKTTGKAMQYEDKRALHLPPIKMPAHRNRSGGQQQPPVQSHENNDSPSTPTTPRPSSRKALTHNPSSGAARGTRNNNRELQHSSSSPSLNKYDRDDNDTDPSYSSPNVKAMARALTQSSLNQSTQQAYDKSNVRRQ